MDRDIPGSKWSKDEDDLLRKYYRSMLFGKDVGHLFPGRSKSAIEHRLTRLGIKTVDARNGASGTPAEDADDNGTDCHAKAEWSDQEVTILCVYFSAIGSNVTCFLPGRSRASVTSMAKKLGLKKTGKMPKGEAVIRKSNWTIADNAILLLNYPVIGPNVSILLGRTEIAVRSRYRQLIQSQPSYPGSL